jgi:hypothetical protein
VAHPVKLPRTKADARAIERLRGICLALPDATEKMAWGEPTWRAGKIFAQMDTHHHGAEHVAVWLPAAFGAQEALVDAHPDRCFVPPYVGAKGWIGVRIDGTPDWKLVASLVEDAYRLIAPPASLAKLGAASAPGRARRSPPKGGRGGSASSARPKA